MYNFRTQNKNPDLSGSLFPKMINYKESQEDQNESRMITKLQKQRSNIYIQNLLVEHCRKFLESIYKFEFVAAFETKCGLT